MKEYPQMYWMGQLSMYYVNPIIVVFASVNYNCNTNHWNEWDILNSKVVNIKKIMGIQKNF